jgi:hypothetical protein
MTHTRCASTASSQVVWARPEADDLDEGFRALEVVWVGGVERELIAGRRGGNHQVGSALTGLAPGRPNRRADLAEEPRGTLVIRERVKGRLDVLQDGYTPGALHRVVGRVWAAVLAVPQVRVVARWIFSWRVASIEAGDRNGRHRW